MLAECGPGEQRVEEERQELEAEPAEDEPDIGVPDVVAGPAEARNEREDEEPEDEGEGHHLDGSADVPPAATAASGFLLGRFAPFASRSDPRHVVPMTHPVGMA